MEVALGLRKNFAFRDALRDRFRYILIDEYQDTNHAQYVIARDLAGDRRNLCATGDPDQSIYGWRGAEISNILDFEKDFPQAKVVKLEQNYRSTQVILKAASAVISHNRHRKKKDLYTDNPPGDPIDVVETDDGEAEANAIVRRIVALRAEGLAFKEMAIFFRTVAQTARSRTPCAARGRRCPTRSCAARASTTARRCAISLRTSWSCTIRTTRWPCGGSSTRRRAASATSRSTPSRTGPGARASPFTRPCRTWPKSRRSRARPVVARHLPRNAGRPHEGAARLLARLLETVIKKSGYLNGLTGEEGHERRSNLDELITLGASFDKMAAEHPDDEALPRGLEGFLESVRLSSDQDGLNENVDRVPLMTLHTAKGLEFPAVFIPGCEDGLLPHERSATSPREIEEERRLFFVGMTRAKRRLTLLHARFRRIRGQLLRCVASPFLGEMPSDTIECLDETTGTRPTMFDRNVDGERSWDERSARSESLGGGGYKAPGDATDRPAREGPEDGLRDERGRAARGFRRRPGDRLHDDRRARFRQSPLQHGRRKDAGPGDCEAAKDGAGMTHVGRGTPRLPLMCPRYGWLLEVRG